MRSTPTSRSSIFISFRINGLNCLCGKRLLSIDYRAEQAEKQQKELEKKSKR